MSSDSHFDDFVGITEEDSYLSPLLNFRPRARTMTDLNQSRSLGRELDPFYLCPQQVVIPRRSAPHLRLQLSIPGAPPTASSSISPQSESPETPASLSSPIAGVVDLTKHVKTISTYAVAQGGLSDIYKGEWHQSEMGCDGENKEVVVVAIKLLRILTRKDQDGVRARRVILQRLAFSKV
ncbi:hypothetical protein BYT27DRAFT_7192255 [Phlegmacium glaucopus]|nr:hypothetical protein BYT27DRAFT_7192255 [Phlegmacium glaucopus]